MARNIYLKIKAELAHYFIVVAEKLRDDFHITSARTDGSRTKVKGRQVKSSNMDAFSLLPTSVFLIRNKARNPGCPTTERIDLWTIHQRNMSRATPVFLARFLSPWTFSSSSECFDHIDNAGALNKTQELLGCGNNESAYPVNTECSTLA